MAQEEVCWGKVMEEASALLAPDPALQQGPGSEGPAASAPGPDERQGALALAQARAERKVCLQVSNSPRELVMVGHNPTLPGNIDATLLCEDVCLPLLMALSMAVGTIKADYLAF